MRTSAFYAAQGILEMRRSRVRSTIRDVGAAVNYAERRNRHDFGYADECFVSITHYHEIILPGVRWLRIMSLVIAALVSTRTPRRRHLTTVWPKRRFVTDNRDHCFVGTGLIRLGSASFCPGVQARIQFQPVRVRLHYDGSASIDRCASIRAKCWNSLGTSSSTSSVI